MHETENLVVVVAVATCAVPSATTRKYRSTAVWCHPLRVSDPAARCPPRRLASSPAEILRHDRPGRVEPRRARHDSGQTATSRGGGGSGRSRRSIAEDISRGLPLPKLWECYFCVWWKDENEIDKLRNLVAEAAVSGR